MAFTGHGHHIPGTPVSGIQPKQRSKCGEMAECEACRMDAMRVLIPMGCTCGQFAGTSVIYADCPVHYLQKDIPMDPQLKARLAVQKHYLDNAGDYGIGVIVDREARRGDDPSHEERVGEIVMDIDIDDVYVVTFSYTLGNWKALVSTTTMDDVIYEVTYDASKKCMFLDTYKKQRNVRIDDDPISTLREKLMGVNR